MSKDPWAEAHRKLDLIKARWKTTWRVYQTRDVLAAASAARKVLREVNAFIDAAIDRHDEWLLLSSVVDEMKRYRMKDKHFQVPTHYETAAVRAAQAGKPAIDAPEMRGDFIWVYREALFNLASIRELVASRPVAVRALMGFVEGVESALGTVLGVIAKIAEGIGAVARGAAEAVAGLGHGAEALGRNLGVVALGGIVVGGVWLLRRRRA